MNKSSSGSLLVEIILALGLFAVITPALISGIITSRQGEAQQRQRLQASALLKEAQEALRVVREAGWETFAQNGTYHPEISSNSWTLVSGEQSINGFVRSIAISDAYRDAGGNISTSGNPDPSTKKIITTVGWDQPSVSLVSATTYFTRYLDNLSYTETTTADFTAGVHTGTTVVDTGGGAVTLGTGGHVDWCNPSLVITALDLPGQAYASDISAIQGRAYVTTGNNASGESLNRVNITDTEIPLATNTGSYTNFKTYAIHATATYNYLTSDHPGLTVDIVNSNTLTHAGFFNPAGGGQGRSIVVDNNIGYVTVGNKLFTFDASSVTGVNQTQLGSITLAGNGERVVVKNNYAYVAISGSSTKLQIIEVANGGRNLSIIGKADFDSQSARSIVINGDGSRAFVATAGSSTQNELFIINTSSKPSSPNPPAEYSVISSYNTNGMDPKGIILAGLNKIIIVGSGGEQYQVVNIINESNPARCGGISNPNGASVINAVAAVVEADNDSYAYILTNNASREFQIIEGGPGNQAVFNGNFVSKIFALSNNTAFNRYEAHAQVPQYTQVRYQFAVTQAPDCQTASYNFVGPDNTPATFFTDSISAVPLFISADYKNPGNCFRYKVYLTSDDFSATPVFNDITINYSP